MDQDGSCRDGQLMKIISHPLVKAVFISALVMKFCWMPVENFRLSCDFFAPPDQEGQDSK
jgi:hypothetical protein